jgi:coproporphyrinogen III oxidase
MVTIAPDDSQRAYRVVPLSEGQTGNGDSTNVADRGSATGEPGAVVITSVVGSTPTVTVNIRGSVDGVNYFNIPYALVATPETPAVAALTITTAVTTTYLLRPGHAWRFLKLVYSANTNVTLTASAAL